MTAGRPRISVGNPVNHGISLSSTYFADPAENSDEPALDYGRSGNATWAALESALGELEGGRARIFSSGMAAATALVDLLPPRTEQLPQFSIGRGGYYGVTALLRQRAERGHLQLSEVDLMDPAATIAALQPGGILWLESPSNPLLEVADLPTLIAAAQAIGAITVVDNTLATPLGQQPLQLGADIVLHSATKAISGHSDLLLGAVVTQSVDLDQQIMAHRRLTGAIASPFDAFLALRGLRTLAVRRDRAQENAAALATALAAHPLISRVRYPGLPTDPHHERAKAQLRGFGSIIAIDLPSAELARRLISGCRLWTSATSLGAVESMIERRRRHPAEPTSVPAGLVRLSVGIEDGEDLWGDLAHSLERIGNDIS